MAATGRGTQSRGFASMDRDKQRAIASKGGKAAHAKGTAHEWDRKSAAEAGRKGGSAGHKNKQHDHAAGTIGEERDRAADETDPTDDATGDR